MTLHSPSAPRAADAPMERVDASSLDGAQVVVGVSGGIAAYKAAHVVRGLVASGAQVRVIPTPASLEFVGRATWEALSHHEVRTSVFADVEQVAHVRRGQEADLLVIAPATADLLARLRQGRADDLLTAAALMARCPVLVAPAMHTEMWTHPATADNVAVLRERGVSVLEPDSGRLTGPDSGPGRLPEPEAIVAMVRAAMAAPRSAEGAVRRDLVGCRLTITAGGTREAIDPVRHLANASSGRQGFALADAAVLRGAEVTLIAANVDLPTPPGAHRIDVTSAAELAAAVAESRERTDALIMAAAVADFTPAARAGAKIKKRGADDVPRLELVRTVDVLAREVAERGQAHPDLAQAPLLVGFAAETGDEETSALDHARAKARAKGADLLVFNDVSQGVFGQGRNRVVILDREGEARATAEGEKAQVAARVLDELVALRGDVPWHP